MAVHKFTKQVLILDEIYETNRNETSPKKIWPRAVAIMQRYLPVESWYKIYDYAATWFQVEINNEFNVALMPCTKDVNRKDVALSLIKDFMMADIEEESLFIVSNRCTKFIWEITNYSTDEHGKIPKKDDHLIDALRYNFNAAGLSTVPRDRHKRSSDRREWTEIDYLEDTDIMSLPIDFDEENTNDWFE
jgi:hypothetical protein